MAGGMHGRWCGHAWWWACMTGACMAGAHVWPRSILEGHAWWGVCMAGGMHGRRDGHCSRWYASHCNALLLSLILLSIMEIIHFFYVFFHFHNYFHLSKLHCCTEVNYVCKEFRINFQFLKADHTTLKVLRTTGTVKPVTERKGTDVLYPTNQMKHDKFRQSLDL